MKTKERALSGVEKTRTANTETTHSWTITSAPDALFEGKMSMNDWLEKDGDKVSAHDRKMNDFHYLILLRFNRSI